jgi:hypothetical protein
VEGDLEKLYDYKLDRGGDSVVIMADSYIDYVDTSKVNTVDVTLEYKNDIEATLASVKVDEMTEYEYSANISGNTLTFTDTDYSNTNGVYMLTFYDKSENIISSDIFNSNDLLEVTYKVNFSDGTDSRIFKYEPVKTT